MSATAETAVSKKPGMWQVFDLNATQIDEEGNPKPRVHEAAGRRYKLFLETGTEMPEQHARMFLRDASFRVLDADGQHVRSLQEQQRIREAPVRLQPDMVVASLHELSTEALVTRAATLPGGDQFTSISPRPDLIRFITNAQKLLDVANSSPDNAPDARALPPEERARMAETLARVRDPDEIDPAQLDKFDLDDPKTAGLQFA